MAVETRKKKKFLNVWQYQIKIVPFNYVNNSVGFYNPIYGVMPHQWRTTGPDPSSSYLHAIL